MICPMNCFTRTADKYEVSDANESTEPSPEQLELWAKQHGMPIEHLLHCGAIRLLNACWIVEFARSKRALPPRQHLPEAAFVTVEQLQQAMPNIADYLRIVVLSYAWLTPEHPDPKADTLRRLAPLLEVMLKHTRRHEVMFRFVGVFWDWASLHQHAGGRLQRQGTALVRRRSEHEDSLFRQALNSLALLYAHPFTYVVKMTTLPEDYPAGYRLPTKHPPTPYNDRGWCFTESSWATMVKSGGGVIDLSLFDPLVHTGWVRLQTDCARAARKPPLLPSEFERLVATKRFTNGREDQPLVTRLYRAYFEEAFAKAEKLRFNELGWTDADVKQLAAVALSPPGMACVRELWLTHNTITDDGCHTLVGMFDSGGMPELEALFISENTFKSWEAGGLALAECAQRHGFAIYQD